jgi:hypothetical protein
MPRLGVVIPGNGVTTPPPVFVTVPLPRAPLLVAPSVPLLVPAPNPPLLLLDPLPAPVPPAADDPPAATPSYGRFVSQSEIVSVCRLALSFATAARSTVKTLWNGVGALSDAHPAQIAPAATAMPHMPAVLQVRFILESRPTHSPGAIGCSHAAERGWPQPQNVRAGITLEGSRSAGKS